MIRRNIFLALAALVVALASACTATATISDNVCGNGVLEPGEDCDAPGDPACTATCRITCSIDDRATACAGAPDGMCCPRESRCGVDAICHFYSGQLAAELVQPFDITSMTLADIDGDHLLDAIGVNNASILVRYGDAAQPLTRTALAPAPVSTGTLAFADITGDGRVDVVLPTSGGLFAYETSSGAPEPISFPAKVDETVAHLKIAALGAGTPTAFATLDKVGAHLELGSVAADLVTPGAPAAIPCGASTETTVLGRELHPVLDGARALVPLQFGDGSVCISTIAGPVVATSQSVPLPTGLKAPTEGEVLLTPLLGSPCPDLLVPYLNVTKLETLIYAGIGSAGDCTVATTPETAVLSGAAFAAIEIAKPAGGTPAVVTSSGIVDATGTLLTSPTRTWTYAATADLDGDGRPDIVTAGTSTDVEVLFQRAYTTAPQFADVEIQTTDTVQYLALGDFDGDGLVDIAIGAIDPTVTGGPADVEIAWGEPADTFTVTDVDTFTTPHDVIATNLVDRSLPGGYDQFDDLVVAQGGAGSDTDPSRYIGEFGSTSRGLTAPFDYSSAFAGSGAEIRGIGRAVVYGGFGAGNTPALYALFAPQTAATGGDNHTATTLTYTPYGAFAAGSDAPFTSPCPANGSAEDPPLCIDTTHILRVPATAPTPDSLLAVRDDANTTPTTQCFGYAYAGATTFQTATCAAAATIDPSSPSAAAEQASLVASRSAHFIVNTVYGTPSMQLFLGRSDLSAAILWDVTVDAQGPHLTNPIDFDAELTPVVQATTTGATVKCFDVEPADLGALTVDGATYGAAQEELILPCEITNGTKTTTQLWARYAAADPTQPPSYAELLDVGSQQLVSVHAGDINGDGLADLTFTYGTSGAGKVELHVYLQCDTHTTGCTGGGS